MQHGPCTGARAYWCKAHWEVELNLSPSSTIFFSSRWVELNNWHEPQLNSWVHQCWSQNFRSLLNSNIAFSACWTQCFRSVKLAHLSSTTLNSIVEMRKIRPWAQKLSSRYAELKFWQVELNSMFGFNGIQLNCWDVKTQPWTQLLNSTILNSMIDRFSWSQLLNWRIAEVTCPIVQLNSIFTPRCG